MVLMYFNGCKDEVTDLNPQFDDRPTADFFSDGKSLGSIQVPQLVEA